MVSRAYFISQSIDFQHADNIISVSCLNRERRVEGGGNCPRGGKSWVGCVGGWGELTSYPKNSIHTCTLRVNQCDIIINGNKLVAIVT